MMFSLLLAFLAVIQSKKSQKFTTDFLAVMKPEEQRSCKRSPDILGNYKHNNWLQMTEGILSTSLYFAI